MGFPIGRPDSCPHFISGDMTQSYSASEIENMLKNGVIADAIAARNLLDRKIAKKFGLLSINPVSTVVDERLAEDPLNGKNAGVTIPVSYFLGLRSLFTVETEKKHGRALSHFVDMEGNIAGNASTLLESDEARMAVIPFAMHEGGMVEFINAARQSQMGNIFKWVIKGNLPCRILNAANVYPLLFADASLQELIFVAVNISFDDRDQVSLEAAILKEGRWTIDRLYEQGKWKSAPRLLTSEKGVPVLKVYVKAWEAEVLRATRIR